LTRHGPHVGKNSRTLHVRHCACKSNLPSPPLTYPSHSAISPWIFRRETDLWRSFYHNLFCSPLISVPWELARILLDSYSSDHVRPATRLVLNDIIVGGPDIWNFKWKIAYLSDLNEWSIQIIDRVLTSTRFDSSATIFFLVKSLEEHLKTHTKKRFLLCNCWSVDWPPESNNVNPGTTSSEIFPYSTNCWTISGRERKGKRGCFLVSCKRQKKWVETTYLTFIYNFANFF
jgi:hypothetical protein